MYNHTYVCLSQHRWWNCKMHYLLCSQAGHENRSQILKRWSQKTLQSQVLSLGIGYGMAHDFAFPEDPTTGAISSRSHGYIASLFCCHADLPSWPKPWKQGRDCTYCHRSLISKQGAERTKRTGCASPCSLLIHSVLLSFGNTVQESVCVVYAPSCPARLSKTAAAI